MIGIVVGLICGVICSIVASNKGRNAVGWFFLGFFFGIFALIPCLIVGNLKEQEAQKQRLAQENHRLREQIRQEQIKAETFRAHTQRRLDAHDQTLGLDTRVDGNLLEGGPNVAGLLQGGDASQAAGFAASPVQPAPSDANWYYTINGQTYGPITSPNIAQLLRSGTIPSNALFWTSGLTDWQPISSLPGLTALVNT